MTERIPQSTAKTVMFKAYLASDHVTEATGKTIAITISKNGGAFGNPNAGATNATEVSSGWYKVALDATDTATAGPLAVRGTSATIDDVGVLLEVVTEIAAIATQLTALQADLPQRITKNVALSAFPFRMVSSTDHFTPATGLTITAQRSLDGAAFGACANAAAEIGSGWYKIDLAAADLNANTVALKFTATGADQLDVTIVTEPT